MQRSFICKVNERILKERILKESRGFERRHVFWKQKERKREGGRERDREREKRDRDWVTNVFTRIIDF